MPTATSTTLPLDPAVTYDIEVRSIAGTGLSAPFSTTAGTGTGAPKDTVIPTLTVTPAGGTEAAPTAATSVTATSDNGQIFYTDDGTLAVFGDGPSTTAKLYTGPVAITKATNLSFAAFDTAGNIAKPAQDGWYAPDASPAGVLAAPANLKATDGQGKVTLVWAAVPTATGYQVAVYDSTGSDKIATQPPANTGTSQIITAADGQPTSSRSRRRTPRATSAPSRPPRSRASRPWRRTRSRSPGRSGRPTTSGSSAPAPPPGARSASTPSTPWPTRPPSRSPGWLDQPLTAAAAPATGSTFDIRLRNTTGLTKPATIWVKSSNGGVASSAVS